MQSEGGPAKGTTKAGGAGQGDILAADAAPVRPAMADGEQGVRDKRVPQGRRHGASGRAHAASLLDFSSGTDTVPLMKRDMEIIRRLMLAVEDDAFMLGQIVMFEGVDARTCGLHVAMLMEAGLVEGRLYRNDTTGIYGASIERLTNAGHDFCAGLRDETIWKKVREHVIRPGTGFVLSLVAEYVRTEVRRWYP
jgi:hypothetical protein